MKVVQAPHVVRVLAGPAERAVQAQVGAVDRLPPRRPGSAPGAARGSRQQKNLLKGKSRAGDRRGRRRAEEVGEVVAAPPVLDLTVQQPPPPAPSAEAGVEEVVSGRRRRPGQALALPVGAVRSRSPRGRHPWRSAASRCRQVRGGRRGTARQRSSHLPEAHQDGRRIAGSPREIGHRPARPAGSPAAPPRRSPAASGHSNRPRNIARRPEHVVARRV